MIRRILPVMRWILPMMKWILTLMRWILLMMRRLFPYNELDIGFDGVDRPIKWWILLVKGGYNLR
jgi:hypothetical protein